MWIPGTTLESVEPAVQYDGCIGCFNTRKKMISRFLVKTQILFTGFEIWNIISLSRGLFAWISWTWLNKQIPCSFTIPSKFCERHQLSFFMIFCHPIPTGLRDFEKKFCNRWKYFPNISCLHCCRALAGHYWFYNSPQRTIIIVHINCCLWRKAVKVKISFQKFRQGLHQQSGTSPTSCIQHVSQLLNWINVLASSVMERSTKNNCLVTLILLPLTVWQFL